MLKVKSIVCGLSFIFLLAGCSTLKEGAKGLLGISTKVLEDTRKDAIVQGFNADHDTCYNKSIEVLKEIGAYIYAQDRKNNLIAVYISEIDTTPVGIFFKPLDANNTELAVSSPSTFGKEYIAEKLFAKLIIALGKVKK